MTTETHRNHARPTATAVRLLVSVTAMVGLAISMPASAGADAGDASLLNDFGIGNNGAISQIIAQFATSLCPMLVQPGSQVVSTATTASGHGGLGSQLAGGVAGLAIQTQCPNFMTSLANGDFTVLGNAASMMGMATPTANPLSSVTGGVAGSLPGILATPGT